MEVDKVLAEDRVGGVSDSDVPGASAVALARSLKKSFLVRSGSLFIDRDDLPTDHKFNSLM